MACIYTAAIARNLAKARWVFAREPARTDDLPWSRSTVSLSALLPEGAEPPHSFAPVDKDCSV